MQVFDFVAFMQTIAISERYRTCRDRDFASFTGNEALSFYQTSMAKTYWTRSNTLSCQDLIFCSAIQNETVFLGSCEPLFFLLPFVETTPSHGNKLKMKRSFMSAQLS
jgi:hypothetical protein